jgi:hypothetical protein
MKKLLVAFFLVTAGLASAAEPLTCAAQPGRKFCSRLNRFDSLLVSCTGYACYTLWRDQLHQISSFLDEYYDNIFPGDPIGADLATMAQKTSKVLCRQEVTGDAEWISTLSVQYNRFLVALKQLQDESEIKSPYTCKFSR